MYVSATSLAVVAYTKPTKKQEEWETQLTKILLCCWIFYMTVISIDYWSSQSSHKDMFLYIYVHVHVYLVSVSN